MKKNLNKTLNRGKARKADTLRLCRELLQKGNSQREIAKILNVSLQTTNKYCQQIAKEIEDAHKEDVEKAKELRRQSLDRRRRANALRNEPLPEGTPEELAKAGFIACLRELRIRLPQMSNDEVIKITTELWDRVNK